MLVGINGLIGSGKNTVGDYLVEEHKFIHDSFAKTLKDMTSVLMGWPRELLEGDTDESRLWREQVDEFWSKKLNIQDLTPRMTLQLLGTEVLRDNFSEGIWISCVEKRLSELKKETNVVITDCRFSNEVNMIQQKNGILIKVKRGEDPEWWKDALAATDLGFVHAEKHKKILEDKGIHITEWAWANTKFDYIVDNNGTLEELHNTIDLIIMHERNR